MPLGSPLPGSKFDTFLETVRSLLQKELEVGAVVVWDRPWVWLCWVCGECGGPVPRRVRFRPRGRTEPELEARGIGAAGLPRASPAPASMVMLPTPLVTRPRFPPAVIVPPAMS